MVDVIARLKLNLGKRNKLEGYTQYLSQLVSDYTKGEIDLKQKYKGYIPNAVIDRSLELLRDNNNCFYLGVNTKYTKLVVNNTQWNIYKVGRYYSILIPFITKSVRVPLLIYNPTHKSILSEMIMTSQYNHELKGDLYIYSSGLDWKVNMCIHNIHKELKELVMV